MKITEQECKNILGNLESELREHLDVEVEITEIIYYADDGCWSANLEITKGPVKWATDFERDIDSLPISKNHSFSLTGSCTDENPDIPANNYGIYVVS